MGGFTWGNFPLVEFYMGEFFTGAIFSGREFVAGGKIFREEIWLTGSFLPIPMISILRHGQILFQPEIEIRYFGVLSVLEPNDIWISRATPQKFYLQIGCRYG